MTSSGTLAVRTTSRRWSVLDMCIKPLVFDANCREGASQAATIVPTRSYLSQVELPVTLGLGAADHIERLTIRWPDGARQQVPQVEIDRLLEVEQDTSVAFGFRGDCREYNGCSQRTNYASLAIAARAAPSAASERGFIHRRAWSK